jgi:hypothetical protein
MTLVDPEKAEPAGLNSTQIQITTKFTKITTFKKAGMSGLAEPSSPPSSLPREERGE